jgi:rhodanese-related sulfurtransferase
MTRRLHAAGFTKVFNLRNGLGPWRADGMPLQRG